MRSCAKLSHPVAHAEQKLPLLPAVTLNKRLCNFAAPSVVLNLRLGGHARQSLYRYCYTVPPATVGSVPLAVC